MVPDVRHLHEILVQPDAPAVKPEEMLVRLRAAGSDDDPVQSVLDDHLLDLSAATSEEVVFDGNDIWKTSGVLSQVIHINETSDVGSAMTHQDPDLGLIIRCDLYLGRLFYFDKRRSPRIF